jgi:hypothetical protein
MLMPMLRAVPEIIFMAAVHVTRIQIFHFNFSNFPQLICGKLCLALSRFGTAEPLANARGFFKQVGGRWGLQDKVKLPSWKTVTSTGTTCPTC